MKRSEINRAWRRARACFEQHGWTLPPHPRVDITDLGLGDFEHTGIVLVNLAEEPEYCEKLMFCHHRQLVPMHAHKKKKEDIICRWGELTLELWAGDPRATEKGAPFELKRNGETIVIRSGDTITLSAGERVTLEPGCYHAFWPTSDECIIGEVSTANDDLHDNFFVDERIGRFPEIVEDEPAEVRLISEG